LDRERKLTIDDALRIAREVADALGSAHAVGVIHRDIKPENILIQGGHALVADFGIALAVQQAGGARMTQTGLSLGTPQYMSPEQAMGERNIDLRGDLYALGAVTYEMLVGEAPFTGPSVQAIVARVMTEQPRGIALQRKAVPPGVEIAVMRALEKLPADRYSSAAEFVAALGAQVIAAPVVPRAAERRRAYALVAVTAAFLCLAGGWLLGRRAVSSTGAAAWNASVMLPDSLALEPLITNTEGMVTIALSPDGSQLAFVSRKGKDPQLFIRRLSDFSVRAIDGTEGALAPFFSPSGDAVAFFPGAHSSASRWPTAA
jgi:serine/threonine-protein kinase